MPIDIITSRIENYILYRNNLKDWKISRLINNLSISGKWIVFSRIRCNYVIYMYMIFQHSSFRSTEFDGFAIFLFAEKRGETWRTRIHDDFLQRFPFRAIFLEIFLNFL